MRCTRLLSPCLLPLLAAVSLLPLATPVGAVQIYFDVNGDQKQSSADVVSPKGTTNVVIWLDPVLFKEGTSEYCSNGSREGTHRYSLILHARSGTVRWNPRVPSLPNRSDNVHYESDDSTYLIIYGRTPDWKQAPRFPLGELSLTIRRGRPLIEVVDRWPMDEGAPDENHQTRLSTGTWDGPVATCAEKLPYGGTPNRPPVILDLANIPLHAGRSERYVVHATDQDGDAVELRKLRGPSFVSLTTFDPGHGTAQAELVLAPDSCARGRTECIVEASDGFASDLDTFLVSVQGILREPPKTPMQPGKPLPPTVQPPRGTPKGSQWLVGEWEWHGSLGWKGGTSPLGRGYRVRLAFHTDSTFEFFTVTSNGVSKVKRGKYRLSPSQGNRILSCPDPIYDWDHGDFSIWGDQTAFGIYPAGVSDASEDIFVRVPSVIQSPLDTTRLVTPLEGPRLTGQGELIISETMKTALRKWDPAFRPWNESDSRAFPSSSKTIDMGAASVIGDFDADLLPDVALLGSSAADQVLVTVLSNHGNLRVAEVGWRRIKSGQGSNRSRGDPHAIRPVHLELVPSGSPNPFCWVDRWGAASVDAIGVVEQGIGRFDYVFQDGQFSLFAPGSMPLRF